MELIALCWQCGWSRQPEESPAEWVVARVPGAVQLDWARHAGMPDYTFAENIREWEWMESVFWHYRAVIPDRLVHEPGLMFVSKGIDYRFSVRLDGVLLHEQEGMFTPVVLPLGGRVTAGSVLEIIIEPPPKSHEGPPLHTQPDRSCKPAVSYGWDFHPRMIPSGIWDETGLVVQQECHFKNVRIKTALDASLENGWLDIEADAQAAEASSVVWTVLSGGGRTVLFGSQPLSAGGTVRISVPVLSPALWWPHDHGAPELYTVRVELRDRHGACSDVCEKRVGFRRIRLVPNEGAGKEPDGFPKTRLPAPMTLEINNRRIFCRGTNWVTPDIFPGAITAERIIGLLVLAKQTHFNLIRCWGGAPVMKETFFDWCDENGLMVWQEFPLACNRYDGGADYLRVLDQESRSIIRRLESHPSVVIWCGGNELFNSWSGMTDQDAAFRLLNRNCYDLDPDRPFLPTSPLEGAGHGDYRFRDAQGREVYEIYMQSRCTAYCEFGCPGPAPIEVLRRIIPENELFPPRPGGAWQFHSGFGAWDVDPDSWLMQSTLRRYFGDAASLEDLVRQGQFLQAEGCRFIFEEARRQKPYCSMSLNWCFNEPWPTAANNSLISWPAVPKPALAAVRDACRPVLLSIRTGAIWCRTGGRLRGQCFLLNDTPRRMGPFTARVYLRVQNRDLALTQWECSGAEPGANVAGPAFETGWPETSGTPAELVIESSENPGWTSRYPLLSAEAKEDGSLC